MAIPAGTRLGPYEIVAPLGAGGMGEVYKARDTRLQRDVAIKVVPTAIALDAAALARFEREAQAVAALSHPNILAIHDVGHDAGTAFAVMELLSGRTLREVLSSGPLPVRKALDYGRQIADGLAAAHDRGIIHRDVKPENIFITTEGRAKLLDFGLARVQPVVSSAGETMLANGDTAPGTILGTIGYMAPEQVRGLAVDARTDIFAFGAVLYEMLGGTRAFGGDTPADTLSAILHADPQDVAALSGSANPGLDRIVRRALEKEPAQRFQSARDLGFALEAIATVSGSAPAVPGPVVAPSRTGIWLPVALALTVGLVLGAAAWRLVAPSNAADAAATVQRFTIPATEFQVGAEWVAVSPNGQTLAWGGNVASSSSQNLGLWLRRLDRTSAEPMRGITDARRCVFMHDNTRLLCTGANLLFTIDVDNGRRTTVWEGTHETARFQVRSLAVADDGRIAIGVNRGIGVIENGALRMVATPDDTEEGLGQPNWTPDGRQLVFIARMKDGTKSVYAMPVEGGARTVLSLPQDLAGPYITRDAMLVYGQSGVLWAQPFTSAWQPDGPPVRLAGDLGMDASSGFMSASTSNTGMLVFRSPAASDSQFEWVDRTGRLERTVGPTDAWSNFDVTNDGRIVVTRREPFVNGNALWFIDPARQLTTELGPFEGQSHSDPTFSPNGTHFAFRRGAQLILRAMQGGTEVMVRDFLAYPDSFSRDGRYLTVGRPVTGGYDGWVIDMQDPTKDVAIVKDMLLVDELKFSPNGKWIAFHAAQKATPDVFVTPFPPTGERLQISANGGLQPRWNSDGTELFFLDTNGQVMSAAMPGGDPHRSAAPLPLFRTTLQSSSAMDQFAVSADGKRFLIRRSANTDSNEAPVQVMLNWRALLPAAGK
jgi:eukaryotic-like serine/threonine-protein kinase